MQTTSYLLQAPIFSAVGKVNNVTRQKPDDIVPVTFHFPPLIFHFLPVSSTKQGMLTQRLFTPHMIPPRHEQQVGITGCQLIYRVKVEDLVPLVSSRENTGPNTAVAQVSNPQSCPIALPLPQLKIPEQHHNFTDLEVEPMWWHARGSQ